MVYRPTYVLNEKFYISSSDGNGLTFDADEGLTHVVKKTEGGRTHTYEAGFSATNDNDKGYGLYFAVDGSNKLYFDVDDAELVVDGDIWCRSLYLGQSRTDILTYIDRYGVEQDTTDRGKMNAIGGQYISCAGLKIAGSDGSFSIDNNGNVYIENDSIHMQSGNNTIDIDASTGLLFKNNGKSVVNLNIKDGSATFAGNIHTDYDATIGKVLRMVDNGDGTYYASITAGGMSGDRFVIRANNSRIIEISTDGSMYLDAPKGVFVGTAKVATADDLNNIEQEIASLRKSINGTQ